MASRVCSVEGCEDEYCAKGFCAKHYQRWYRKGSPIRDPNEYEGQLTFYRFWYMEDAHLDLPVRYDIVVEAKGKLDLLAKAQEIFSKDFRVLAIQRERVPAHKRWRYRPENGKKLGMP